MATTKNKTKARTAAKDKTGEAPRKASAKESDRPFPVPVTDTPCPRCYDLYMRFKIRGETVMQMPVGACAPMEMYRPVKCCRDCAAADTVIRRGMIGSPRDRDSDRETQFIMARIAVGNDRQLQLRAPGIVQGLVLSNIVTPSAPGDMDKHHAWLAKHAIHHGIRDEGMTV